MVIFKVLQNMIVTARNVHPDVQDMDVLPAHGNTGITKNGARTIP